MNIAFIGMAAALGLSACGSAFGAGFAGQASIGAWKKCYAAGKPAPFIMIAFTGAPLTQTIYGFLLMNFINSSNCDPGKALGVGLFGGHMGLDFVLNGFDLCGEFVGHLAEFCQFGEPANEFVCSHDV